MCIRDRLYTVNMSRLEGFKQAYDMMDQKIDESLLFLELETDDLRMQAVSQALELSLIHI